MQTMKEFAMWWLSELPEFLLAEPICYFVGLAVLFVVAALIRQIINLH